jgi:hypothetical protein
MLKNHWEISMDKRSLALGGLSVLLLASTSAEAQKPITTQTMTTLPPAKTNSALDIQRSKTINQASPAAINKTSKNAADIKTPWLEKWAQANTSAINPVGNVQKSLKQQR